MVFCQKKLCGGGPRKWLIDLRDKMVKDTHGLLNVWTLEFKDPKLKKEFAEMRQQQLDQTL